MGMSLGNFNQDLIAAFIDLSSHFRYFLLLVVKTNWWHNDGMKLDEDEQSLLRLQRCQADVTQPLL